jgi:hypothetical protein
MPDCVLHPAPLNTVIRSCLKKNSRRAATDDSCDPRLVTPVFSFGSGSGIDTGVGNRKNVKTHGVTHEDVEKIVLRAGPFVGFVPGGILLASPVLLNEYWLTCT